MNSSFSRGHIGLVILLLGGVWLLIAPVWIGFSGHHLASRLDQGAGVLVILAAVVGFLLQGALGVGDMVNPPPSTDD